MPRLLPSTLPFIHGRAVKITDEQKLEARGYTKETLTTVRDLLRELDLPVTSFDSVLDLYRYQCSSIVTRDEDKRMLEQETKVGAMVNERAKAKGLAPRMGQCMPLGMQYAGVDPYEDIEREVRAELGIDQ